MTEKEFRFMHSQLIEYYQYIEMRLRFICAEILADENRDWFARLEDFKKDPFGTLIQEIQEKQDERQIFVLTKEDLDGLDKTRNKRNYWVHQCFGGMPQYGPLVVFENGEMKKTAIAQMIRDSLSEAVDWDAKLTERLKEYCKDC